MFAKRLIRHPLALAGAVALLIAGCILSGQFVIIVEWTRSDKTSTETTINAEEVDLTGDETWQDHKDNIQNIVDVKFEATITNNLASEATGEIYVSANELTTLAQIQSQGTRVLHGIVVPASGTVTIEFNESTKYQEHLQELLDLVETGQFWLYGIAADTPFSITIKQGSRIMVTFSAGP